jgi:hypothetical protein
VPLLKAIEGLNLGRVQMHIKTKIVTAAICLFVPVMIAASQNAQQVAPVLSLKHFNFESLIKEVDADKDGVMTKVEWKNAGLPDRYFAICDVNRDNKLTRREMKICELPQVMDSNHDDILTVTEMVEFEKKMADKK